VIRSTTSGPVPKQMWTKSWRTFSARSMSASVVRTQSRAAASRLKGLAERMRSIWSIYGPY